MQVKDLKWEITGEHLYMPPIEYTEIAINGHKLRILKKDNGRYVVFFDKNHNIILATLKKLDYLLKDGILYIKDCKFLDRLFYDIEYMLPPARELAYENITKEMKDILFKIKELTRQYKTLKQELKEISND